MLEVFDTFSFSVDARKEVTFNIGIDSNLLCCVYDSLNSKGENKGKKLISAYRMFKERFQKKLYLYVLHAKALNAKHVKFDYVDDDLKLFRPSRKELWSASLQKLYTNERKICTFC